MIQLRRRLVTILSTADPSDLVARLSVTYAVIDPDQNESDSNRSPAHVEYLALLALGLGMPRRSIDPREQIGLTWEAIDIVRDLVRGAADLVLLESMKSRRDNPDDRPKDIMRASHADEGRK